MSRAQSLRVASRGGTGTMFDVRPEEKPGPGDYSLQDMPNLNFASAPKIGMGARVRRESAQNDVPPPGTYDPLRSLGYLSRHPPKFTMGERTRSFSTFSRPEVSLGPGSYNVDISTLRRTGAGTFGIRHTYSYKQSYLKNPAANAYQPVRGLKATSRAEPAISMTFGDKKIFECPKSQLDVPGCQYYDVKLASGIKKAGKMVISTRPTPKDPHAGVPGVGTYSIAGAEQTWLPRAPAFSMGARHARGDHF